uniref:Uncharacterized protein n=1 Tax=Sphaerodactylus townsendi TaxID=933632 RepID=A0ACB8EGQ1_9SAUR
MHCQAEQSLAPPGQLETARRRYKTFMIDEILSEDTCDDLGKLSLFVGPELLPPCTDKIQVRSAEIAQSAQVLEANQQVVALSADGQQYLLAADQESLYQNVMQDSNETLPSMASPLQLQAGFPVHNSELLTRLEPEPQAWAPEVQRSNDGAEDQPAKLQLARSPEPGMWWYPYQSPVRVPSSDSSSSDNESSSEKEEERNVKPEGLRITKPRAALLGNCELQQENCESRQNQQPVQLQDSTRIQFSVTSENDKGLLKSRKRKSRTDPENNLFVCPHCRNGYHRKSTLNRHVETIHNKTKLDDWAPRTKSFLKKSNTGTRVKRRLKTSHSGKEPYECPECGESFQKSASFTKHRRTHADEVRFQCPACDRSYIKQRYLVKHLINAHSGAYLSECLDCGKSFLGEEDLSMHQTKIHGGGGFRQCLDCGKCYQEKLSLITHQTLQDPFQCPECERSFVCKRSLANHRRIHQKEKLRKSLNQEGSDPEESLYKCPDCGKCFKVERRFVNHQRNHMKEQQSLQPDQGEILKVEVQDPDIHTEMQRHTESACGKPLGARLSQPEAEVEEMLQRSPDCGKIFGDSQCFANHQSMHIKEGTSDNADSEETIEERKLPHAHQQEGHQEGKPYQCGSCEKSYATQYYLTWHQRIHADRRPYNCTICGKTFPYRYSLALHETTHTKGKACPHKCSYCGKGFTTETSLSKHLQRHLMEKPYQCNVCGKAFPYRYSLTHHQEIHVKGKAHKCLFCYKTFRTKHFLQRHMRIHLETKSYQCSVCGKAFATKYSFYRHQDRHLSRHLSPSSGKDQVDGSALAIDQASDTDENSNNWSGSSTLFGHHVEETPVECTKSADGSPLARCQSVHVEENPSKALDCEGGSPKKLNQVLKEDTKLKH